MAMYQKSICPKGNGAKNQGTFPQNHLEKWYKTCVYEFFIISMQYLLYTDIMDTWIVGYLGQLDSMDTWIMDSLSMDIWIPGYRKVTSSMLSRLVAHLRIYRLFMKGKFDAYVL